MAHCRIVRDSVVVSQHCSVTVIFLAMFYLTNYRYSPPLYSLSRGQLQGQSWMLFLDLSPKPSSIEVCNYVGCSYWT